MSNSRQLILSATISGFGSHPGAPDTYAASLTDLEHYRRLVQTAERGLLDFVLLDDARAVALDHPAGRLDGLSVFAWLAPQTSRIGLAVSKPTTYTEPFTVSRELATLDFVSGGRAAWNVTTNATQTEAQNFGEQQARPAAERRAIAEEYITVSRKLWDSWEDDAVITDRAGGLYLDPQKLHHIDHVGEYFKIRGPQITYRPPQGNVVVVAIDGGDKGVPLDATLADVLVLHHPTLDEAQQAYRVQGQLASAAGRVVRVLQAVLPILGETEAQARARAAALDAAAPQAIQPHALRLVGTPQTVAETLADWFGSGAADGFHLLPATLPDGLSEIASLLVPELQKRGLFRTAYAGTTLREHLGLARPDSQYAGVPAAAFEIKFT
jgi:alkanesulfonate monooxygenase SsuD/methylene tetrahydromethanopterin reductase-like flavin-dependent oxidoreductase (luciferase family)